MQIVLKGRRNEVRERIDGGREKRDGGEGNETRRKREERWGKG